MEYSQLPSTLPAWADLPSNDRASSQDLDEVSFQVGHGQPANCRPPWIPLHALLVPDSMLGLDLVQHARGTHLPTSWPGMQNG